MAVPVVRRVSRGNVWWNTLGKAVAACRLSVSL